MLGLDPDPAALWPEALERIGGPGDGAHLARIRTAEAVTEHCRAAIVAAGPACVGVKLQLACFERLGAPGWEALEQVVAIGRDHGLLVLADGKRGDVPVTATAYAQALVGETPGPFGPVRGLAVDAFTANPLLGRDALEPLADAAAAAGAGCFVLVRTSNPGAAELQDEGEPPLHERLARLVDELGAPRTRRGRSVLRGRRDGRDPTGPPRPPARADAEGDLPAAGRGRPGRAGRGAGPGVRAPPGGRARDGVALDRERSGREGRRLGGRGPGGRGGASRGLVEPVGVRRSLFSGPLLGTIDARSTRTTTKLRAADRAARTAALRGRPGHGA